MRCEAYKWGLRFGVLGFLGSAYLLASTACALVEFYWHKNDYPRLSYAAPDFRPEVKWVTERPGEWTSLSSLPRAAWLSLIAAEDGGFLRHNGVEWRQSYAKIRADLAKGQRPHGISTLNQQLAKNLYFGARPAAFRKLQEVVVAHHMDSSLGKKRVLELYLNTAEWGPNVVGIGAAARYYFNKPASRLSDYECAVLANLLPNPRVRGAWVKEGRVPGKLSRRINRTLRRLPWMEQITRAQLLAIRDR
jgi:monofunctional biosynthetic peptidoglycan transglycosylase